MADINYTYDVYDPDGARPHDGAAHETPTSQEDPTVVGGLVRMLGAVASLALIAGVGVWGFKLVVRDVSGVPVVRALEGPMRIQPVNPGGSQAAHQGLAVNDVAADGSAAPTADRVMLAPGPVDLTEEDTPQEPVVLATQSFETPQGTGETAEDDLASLSVDALVAQLVGQSTNREAGQEAAQTEGQNEAPNSQVASPASEVTETQAAPDVQPEVLDNPATPDVQAEVEAVGVPGPGLTRSLRPRIRPARTLASGDAAVLNSALSSAVDASAQLEIDPGNLAAGTRLAQLGAYESAEIARAEWVKMTVEFRDYFENKQRVIQKASSGGRTFYRLRAMGFDDLSSARRFCSALISENADCIPVTSR